MKKVLFLIAALSGFMVGKAQLMLGSIQPGAAVNQVDIMFSPDQSPGLTEYVNYLSISVAIPSGFTAGTPTISTAGTPFSNMVMQPAVPLSYVTGGERIYSWIATNLTITTPTVWVGGTPFKGATVTFNGPGGSPSAQVKLVDFTNLNPPGGTNGNTYFFVVTNVNDWTDYTNYFYAIPGPTSTTGTYGNGDHWAQTSASIVLPIDLLSFSGYKDGGRNQLRWTTSTEQNNRGFEVQRSLDGVNYNAIGFVNSMANGGNSSVQLNYTFTDNNVTGLRQYYRLRQVDFGGNNKLSNIVLIKSDKPTIITIDGIFPNPATTTINLLVGAPVKDKVSIVVTDMAGRIMITKNMNVETGSNTLPLDVSGLAGGNYFIRMVDSNGEVVSGKFVKN